MAARCVKRKAKGFLVTSFLNEKKITYISSPKCGCTSAKNFMFYVDNGFAFKRYKLNGDIVGIHQIYPTLVFDDIPLEQIRNHAKFALVRDPVKRVISTYTNKVIQQKVLEKPIAANALKDAGMLPSPRSASSWSIWKPTARHPGQSGITPIG